MIKRKEFIAIWKEVKKAIQDSFIFAHNNSLNENDFIQFLAHSEYLESLEGANVNPYIIDYTEHRHRDAFRINHLTRYLNEAYTFEDDETADSEDKIARELMIYTHIWESKPFLRQLKRLALMTNSEEYGWKVEIPDFTKHKFIRQEVREIFDSKELQIGNVIKKGYHSSLRNSFAHSEFYFDKHNSQIVLTNYKGEDWEIEKISFDEWTQRFCYSFLLSYEFQSMFLKARKQLQHEGEGYPVIMKDKNGKNVVGVLFYDKTKDFFRGIIK
ncbi:hypothetical protein [Carboxylicivirga sp. N1Y90]|uniref:hypothetical protein n=1 Tax=Carboxylicivirga fragile TaxID=3417571 RepID=UPI003D3547EF|nr:hypothetical protein [Marinilabiliaceae bacterium N1Y90]